MLLSENFRLYSLRRTQSNYKFDNPKRCKFVNLLNSLRKINLHINELFYLQMPLEFVILSFPITGLSEFIVRSNYLLSVNTEVFIAFKSVESYYSIMYDLGSMRVLSSN
jgi:hypothetical protein